MDPPDRQVGYAVALFGSRQPTCQRKVLAAYARRNLVRSISRSGNVGGNAALERFFSLKADALSGKRIAPEATSADASDSIKQLYNAIPRQIGRLVGAFA